LEVATVLVDADDGADLMRMVFAVVVIGIAVWAVSKLFPGKRGRCGARRIAFYLSPGVPEAVTLGR
jgi:hypothetical protein